MSDHGAEMVSRIKQISAEIAKLFPAHVSVKVSGKVSGLEQNIEIDYHGCKTYQDATEWFRNLGIQVRRKRVYDTYTSLSGERDGVTFVTYPDELPPTCRRVTKVERIPKTEVRSTGEFVEITRTVVECGHRTARFGDELPETESIEATATQIQPATV